MALNPALANNITLVKNYIDDAANTYAVWKAASLTGDLETPFVQFIGASTMSYPVMPLKTDTLEDYSKTTGFARTNATLTRREVTVSQDKGYQMGIDYLDLADSHTTAIAFFNNEIRQKDVPSIDKYRLNKLATDTNVTKKTVTVTKSNFFEEYDAAVASFINNEVPVAGSILYVTTGVYSAIKNSDQVKRIIESADKNIDRSVEYLDSEVKLVVVPATRMPSGVEFILVNPAALICGVKHSVARMVEEPEDFDGVLINRRIVHDLFVQQDRAKGVYVAKAKAEE